MASTRSRNPADFVLRGRVREPVHFPDLSERRALKLSCVMRYVARTHFELWHRRFLGGLDYERLKGVFTPLFYVEMHVSDLPLDPIVPLEVRGETFLAKTLNDGGHVDRLIREGSHTVSTRTQSGETIEVARARLINIFTRYDRRPGQRRVTELPAGLGLGPGPPSRVSVLPRLQTLLPSGRKPDFLEADMHVWHYGQTDSNRHVNGVEYLRMMECYVADILHWAGRDMRCLHFCRARIMYLKPCFRGEGYRRAAWLGEENPLTLTGAYLKDGDPDSASPAVAVELGLACHQGPESASQLSV